jgi:hypothetical protein
LRCHSSLPVLFSLLFSCFACERASHNAARPKVAPSASASAGKVAPTRSAAPLVMGEGASRIPFDFPAVPTTAAPKQFVLAPPRTWLDAALERGASRQAFIYYGAWMKTPGSTASALDTLTERTETIPNSLIVPIARGVRVGPGDIVLTAWASGTGMQRAIVVSGGSEASPRVRYLDMTLDNPSGWGKKEDTLPENTFTKLEKAGQLGTTAACKEAGHHMRYVVTQAH